MKQYNLFFNGTISNHFNGHLNLYLGDQDFVFANESTHIIAEIKTISKDYTFTGKKVSFNQAKQYASLSNVKDNYGRIIKTFLFEYHKYVDKPYIIIVPFKTPTLNEIDQKEFLNYKDAKMLYIGEQLNQWFDGTLTRYVKPKKQLLCI